MVLVTHNFFNVLILQKIIKHMVETGTSGQQAKILRPKQTSKVIICRKEIESLLGYIKALRKPHNVK